VDPLPFSHFLSLLDQALASGDLPEARSIVVSALAAAALPGDRGTCLHRRAILEERSNELESAESTIREALALDEVDFGPVHPAVARDLHSLAAICFRQARLDAAQLAIDRSLSINSRLGGSGERLTSLMLRADIGRMAGDWARVAADLAEALPLGESWEGPRGLRPARCLYGLGEAYLRDGREQAAHSAWCDLSRRLSGVGPALPPAFRQELGHAWLGLGEIALRGRRDPLDAAWMFAFAAEVLEEPGGQGHAERRLQHCRGLLDPTILANFDAARPLPEGTYVGLAASPAHARGDVGHAWGGRWSLHFSDLGTAFAANELLPDLASRLESR
jgi:tetratricopeptide (TPR) repeat protein